MIKVTLRKKKLKSEKESLYLDYYPEIINPTTGAKTRREFLDLHVYINPKNQEERKYNQEAFEVANLVKSKRELQIRNKEFGFKENINLNVDFVNFYQTIVDEYYNKTSLSNYNTWKASLNHFINFSNGIIMSSQLDTTYINRYRNYLLQVKTTRNAKEPKRISINTASSYYKNFIYVLKQAYKRNFISINLAEDAKYIKEEETHREYLTEEELTALWKTPIKDEKVKHMALFSALTGLRFIDVTNLTWKDVFNDKHQGYYIQFREQKTKNIKNHPISETAYNILKSQDNSEDLIFGNIKYSQITRPLKLWLQDANITKKISFHNFRHSYATLQLANGTDIYTVSKLLGHKNVATTQIYTKILDKNKIEAANRINLNLDGIS
ncbi:site-specific integrase [Flavobacterium sp. NRK F7]|uniref:tyrosine-type recombinase/integrase n=1 Tax=Flavobacterium sp. NRK F7 TaxID=2954930 RepID=UPI002090C00B|nr:site-specific integrase [Flavobacterium sp. NRK F7]MCO6164507.1 site-specific integrase [Flavobacterium sp. NRK F7]